MRYEQVCVYSPSVCHDCALQLVRQLTSRLDAVAVEATHNRVQLNALSRSSPPENHDHSSGLSFDLPRSGSGRREAPFVHRVHLDAHVVPQPAPAPPSDTAQLRVDAIRHRIESSIQRDAQVKLSTRTKS
jgi:hypothetical protein